MGAKILVVGAMLLTIASICLLDAPKTSALELSHLVQSLTNPITTLISNDEGGSASGDTKTDKNPSSSTPPPVSQSGGSKSDMPTSSSPPATTAPMTTGSSEVESIALPEEISTKSQIAPPPSTAIPAYSKSVTIVNGKFVVATTMPLSDDRVQGAAIERTSRGWRIGDLFWYQWMVVVGLVSLAVIGLRYQWRSLEYQPILSKK